MFSLVIAIIAIALVAVLVAATFYYGSDAFQGNKSQARYAEIVNQSEQISSAFIAFRVRGNEIDSTTCSSGDPSGCLQQLVDSNYLNGVPDRNEQGKTWNVDPDGSLYTTTEDKDACIEANESQGYNVENYSHDSNGNGVPDSGSESAATDAGAICIETGS